MKILQINVTANIGSTGRIVEQLGNEIIQEGWESYIAYGRSGGKSTSKIIKIGTKVDQALHLLRTRLLDQQGFGSYFATKKLIKRIKSLNPDIIHLHQMHGYYLNLKVLFKFLKKYNRPVVWTFHDVWPMTGHCCYFNRYNCEKWKTGCFSCPLTKYYPSSWGYDNSTMNYELKKRLFQNLPNLTITPVSNWLGAVVKESFLSTEKVSVISNGVDIDLFKPTPSDTLREKLGIKEKKVILSVAAIWSDHKGLKDIIEISKMIDNQTIMIVIGLSDIQIQTLPSNIIGIKRTENIQQLAEYYSLADLFINPSKAESFGLVTVEAMACGTPVVVYNTTACPELVSQETGMVVELNNIEAMYKAAVQIINNGKQLYAEQCRNRVVKLFNKKTQLQKHIEIYKELMDNETL